MRLGMIGSGYVGLVSGACFAEFGIEVVCVDKNETKVNSLKEGKIPIYEPGLEDLVHKQREAGRLSFTTKLEEAVAGSDAVFIAVGTPSRRHDGGADLSHVFEAAREIARLSEGYQLVVTKSTVPVGTARKVREVLQQTNPNVEFDVCSNPEFLREGAAINDFMRPDRVVIGADTERAVEVMRKLYRPLYINETPMLITTLETAEIVKYASNAFLATKITFINEIANLCEKTNANVQDVARGMGFDGRIGSKFLHAGPGFGGSCFPKDTKALAQIGKDYNCPQNIVETVITVNENRQKMLARRIIEACGNSLENKKIGILGLSFKPNTDDVRDAPSLVIIPELQKAGAEIAAYDPAAMEQAAKIFDSDIEWCEGPYDVAENAHALVILTEWNEFRSLNLSKLAQIMAEKRLIDLRNVYKTAEVNEYGFHYISVGRPELVPAGRDLKVAGTGTGGY